MKYNRICAILFALLLMIMAASFSTSTITADANEIKYTAKAVCLMDNCSGEIAFEKDGKSRLPIASMTKIMTLNVIFDEIDNGNLKIDDKIMVSKNAMGMGGSQVFLESGAEYLAKDLIKSIVIASANDSCVAIAEHIAGSEEGFTDLMNEKATKLNMLDTNFANVTGLPSINGYSSAIDMCIAMRELITHKEYFEFSRIWTDEISHPQGRITEISNTNKLLRRNIGVDAGKTGFTLEALHCITATSVKGNQRYIACVIGADSSLSRFDQCENLLKSGFANYESVALLDTNTPVEKECKVNRGVSDFVKATPKENYYSFTKRKVAPSEIVEITFNENVKAPLKKGDEIGVAKIYKNGNLVKEIPLLSFEDVNRRSIFGIF